MVLGGGQGGPKREFGGPSGSWGGSKVFWGFYEGPKGFWGGDLWGPKGDLEVAERDLGVPGGS